MASALPTGRGWHQCCEFQTMFMQSCKQGMEPCCKQETSGVYSCMLQHAERSFDLTKVVSPSLQLPHSSFVRVTSKTYIAAAAREVARLLCLQRTATLRHPCAAESSGCPSQYPQAQHSNLGIHNGGHAAFPQV